jgi:hypothetical protein
VKVQGYLPLRLPPRRFLGARKLGVQVSDEHALYRHRRRPLIEQGAHLQRSRRRRPAAFFPFDYSSQRIGRNSLPTKFSAAFAPFLNEFASSGLIGNNGNKSSATR